MWEQKREAACKKGKSDAGRKIIHRERKRNVTLASFSNVVLFSEVQEILFKQQFFFARCCLKNHFFCILRLQFFFFNSYRFVGVPVRSQRIPLINGILSVSWRVDVEAWTKSKRFNRTHLNLFDFALQSEVGFFKANHRVNIAHHATNNNERLAFHEGLLEEAGRLAWLAVISHFANQSSVRLNAAEKCLYLSLFAPDLKRILHGL